MASSRRYEADYFTATILEWKHLLAKDEFKNIVVGSMRHMVAKKRAMIYAFVIMNNHMHLIWHILHPDIRGQSTVRHAEIYRADDHKRVKR